MLFKVLSALFLVCVINTGIAAPWVEPDDLALRNDIQLLADAGVISAPVTTYPLMWNAIKDDILSASMGKLTDEQRQALSHVRFSYRYASGLQNITKKSIYVASDEKRFTSFGNDNFDKGNITLSDEFVVGNFAGKLQANYRLGLDDQAGVIHQSKTNIDGSYLAYKMGNWVLSAGAIQRWWGPGIDTSLIMSTNARALPAMTITRDNSNAFETPWLSWLGPWTLTAQMAQLEEERAVSDTLMWSTRATIRPFRGLEIGTAWSFQWAGEGQPGSIKDFFQALFGGNECANGEQSCDPDNYTQSGNHIAGYDVRWSDTFIGLPYALYFQTIGEDKSPNALITDKASAYGIETRFTLLKQRILANLEYSDTQVPCFRDPSEDENTFDCFYENKPYQSGYRYYRRTIGSTYDNDAQTLTATFLIQTTYGNTWQIKLRSAKLNTDNSDWYPNEVNLGNTVSKVAEDVLQFDGQYKFIALDSRFTVGLIITDFAFENSELNTSEAEQYKNSTELDAYLKWEYRF